jgi:hypothetical protein
MDLIPLLGPTGQPMFRVGGACAWKQFHKRGYVISLEWARNPDTRRVEPAMMIWSATGNSADMGVWCCFRSGGSRLATPDNKPTPAMYQEAADSLEILGRASIAMEATAFIDVVMEYMDDLVQMPLAPRSMRDAPVGGQAMWEVTQHVAGSPNKVISERAI